MISKKFQRNGLTIRLSNDKDVKTFNLKWKGINKSTNILSFLNNDQIFSIENNNGVIITGNDNSKVIIKVFSSLTCPHCANFHIKIFQKLKIDFVDKNKVKYEHHAFPLDLAALNAEKVLGCVENDEKKLKLLNELYKNQGSWAGGSDINSINQKIFKITNNYGLNNDKNKRCLNDQDLEDEILNERINASKKY